MPYTKYGYTRNLKKGYRKGYRKRNKGSKSTPWYDQKYSATDAARYALSQVWRLKGLVNSEMLKQDIQYSESSTNAGVVDPLTEIAQGDSSSTRTGNSIYVRSVNVKGLWNWNSAGDANQTVRCVVIQDTQQIGDTRPAWTDVFAHATVVSHLNPNTVGRFKILYNQVFDLNTQNPRRHFEINLAMRHHVRFNGANSTDIQRGGLYMLHLSTQASTNYPTLYGESRVSYHDN